jgi:hypothetical protein
VHLCILVKASLHLTLFCLNSLTHHHHSHNQPINTPLSHLYRCLSLLYRPFISSLDCPSDYITHGPILHIRLGRTRPQVVSRNSTFDPPCRSIRSIHRRPLRPVTSFLGHCLFSVVIYLASSSIRKGDCGLERRIRWCLAFWRD